MKLGRKALTSVQSVGPVGDSYMSLDVLSSVTCEQLKPSESLLSPTPFFVLVLYFCGIHHFNTWYRGTPTL